MQDDGLDPKLVEQATSEKIRSLVSQIIRFDNSVSIEQPGDEKDFQITNTQVSN